MDFTIGSNGGGVKVLGISESDTTLTTISAPGGANSKGSWTIITTSTPKDASEIYVLLKHTGAISPSILVDIGIGPTGSEIVLISNLLTGDSWGSASANLVPNVCYSFPISIPANTQISMRYQTSVTGLTLTAAIIITYGGLIAAQPLNRIATYGDNTATSGGTSIDAGATANKMGAWTQLSGSIAFPISAITIVNKYVAGDNGTRNFFIELGIGPSGSELTVFRHHISKHMDNWRTMFNPWYGRSIPYYVNIPAGQRLSARMQTSITSSPSRTQDVIVYAIS